jgi:hypothetical protein
MSLLSKIIGGVIKKPVNDGDLTFWGLIKRVAHKNPETREADQKKLRAAFDKISKVFHKESKAATTGLIPDISDTLGRIRKDA